MIHLGELIKSGGDNVNVKYIFKFINLRPRILLALLKILLIIKNIKIFYLKKH